MADEHTEPTEVELLEEVRSGNQEAFAEVVRRYQGRLYNYVYRFAHSREDAEDLVSDTLFAAFTKLSYCRDLAKFRAWLFRIAHNLGVNFWRKRKRELSWTFKLEGLAYEVASWTNSPHEEALKKESGLVLERALKELPEHYRAVLLLFYYEGFSYHEMVDILGIPVSSIKTHLFRGRKLLEAKLQSLGHGAPTTSLSDVTPLRTDA